MKQHIPNILTYARLVLCLVMFAAFVPLANLGLGNYVAISPALLTAVILGSFIVAAVTDFFDGYLARKWNVVSMTGAILDPIADKVLVCGGIVGLCTITQSPHVLITGGVILFREFAVSALREVLAPKGIKLPVTFLAKTKTTLQLVALAFLMVALFRPFWSEAALATTSQWLTGAYLLLYVAAAITVWTGVEYGFAARKALKA